MKKKLLILIIFNYFLSCQNTDTISSGLIKDIDSLKIKDSLTFLQKRNEIINTAWRSGTFYIAFFNDTEMIMSLNYVDLFERSDLEYFKYKFDGDSIKADCYGSGSFYELSLFQKDKYTLEGIFKYRGGTDSTGTTPQKFDRASNMKKMSQLFDNASYNLITLKKVLDYPNDPNDREFYQRGKKRIEWERKEEKRVLK